MFLRLLMRNNTNYKMLQNTRIYDMAFEIVKKGIESKAALSIATSTVVAGVK